MQSLDMSAGCVNVGDVTLVESRSPILSPSVHHWSRIMMYRDESFPTCTSVQATVRLGTGTKQGVDNAYNIGQVSSLIYVPHLHAYPI